MVMMGNILNDENDIEMILRFARERKTRFSVSEIASKIGNSRAVMLVEKMILEGSLVKDSSGMIKIKPTQMND
jgi:hypothetical protein